MLELVIINGIIVAIRIFLIKKVSLQPNFKTRSRLHIKIYVTGRPFSMYITISMRKETLSYNRATHIVKSVQKEWERLKTKFFALITNFT